MADRSVENLQKPIMFKGRDLKEYVTGVPTDIDIIKTKLDEAGGGVLFTESMVSKVIVYVPKKKVSPLLLLYFASVGVIIAKQYIDLMKVLCFGVTTPGDIYEATKEVKLFTPMATKEVDIPDMSSIETVIKNLGNDIKRASDVLHPILELEDMPINITINALTQTCELMIAISHRLSKLTEQQISSLNQTTPMIKSGLTFFPMADLALLQAISLYMCRNSAWRRFSIGFEVARNYAIVWEKVRRSADGGLHKNAISFFVVGLKGSGFLALTLLHQTATRLQMEYSSILTSIRLKVSDILYLLLRAKKDLITDPNSWYLYSHLLFPECMCEFSASSHPEMCYIFYGVVGQQLDQTIDYGRVGAWVHNIPIPVQQKPEQISAALSQYGGASLELAEDILQIDKLANPRDKSVGAAITSIIQSDTRMDIDPQYLNTTRGTLLGNGGRRNGGGLSEFNIIAPGDLYP